MGSSTRPFRELAVFVAMGVLLAGCVRETRPEVAAASPPPESGDLSEASTEGEDGQTPLAAPVTRDGSTRSPAASNGSPTVPCPRRLGEASVWPEETTRGAALVFIGTGSVDELRDAVAALTNDYEQGATVAMRAHLDQVHGGIRLVLEAVAPGDVAAVRAFAVERATGLARSCPTVELQLVRGDDEEGSDVERKASDELDGGVAKDGEKGDTAENEPARGKDEAAESDVDERDEGEKREKAEEEKTDEDEDDGETRDEEKEAASDDDEQEEETGDDEEEGDADGEDDSDDGEQPPGLRIDIERGYLDTGESTGCRGGLHALPCSE